MACRRRAGRTVRAGQRAAGVRALRCRLGMEELSRLFLAPRAGRGPFCLAMAESSRTFAHICAADRSRRCFRPLSRLRAYRLVRSPLELEKGSDLAVASCMDRLDDRRDRTARRWWSHNRRGRGPRRGILALRAVRQAPGRVSLWAHSCRFSWWATRDSNPDGLPHTPLKRARLPVPPAARLQPDDFTQLSRLVPAARLELATS